MIRKEELYKIGKLQKSHGIRGEITLIYEEPEFADVDTEFYFLDIESIFVPFLIEEVTIFGDNRGRIKFEDVNDENIAARYSNCDVYLFRDKLSGLISKEKTGWDYFLGYTVTDHNNRILGVIEHVDSSTLNTLFILESADDELYIPATEEFIVEISEEDKIITMQLPEGLID